MVPNINCAVKHNALTLPVNNVRAEQLGGRRIIVYHTDLPAKTIRYTVTPSFIVKQLNFTVFAVTISGNVKSNKTFSFQRINHFSIQFTCRGILEAFISTVRISLSKTKSLTIAKHNIKCEIKLTDTMIEQVPNFNYLVVEISAKRDLKQMVRVQTMLAARISGCLYNLI